MPTRPLPRFSVDEYRAFLRDVQATGRQLLPVEAMPEWDGRPALYLRHDVDLHIPGVERIAHAEAELGARATYFVPLTLHFNPFYPANRDVLREIAGLGHRIGLHYDLQTYPWEVEDAWRHLDFEAQTLAAITGAPVESICMHFPWGGREDIFALGDRYVHPHDPRRFGDVVYVSDSCRAWRDETLLSLFSDAPPDRLLLNTHPELWLGGADEAREAFLNGTLLENTVRQHAAYVIEHMGPAWEKHPAPRLHEAREAARSAVAE